MSSVYSRSVTLEIEGDSVIKYFITWIFFKAIYYVYDSFLKVVRQVLAPRERRHMCICNLQIVDIYQNIRPRQHTGDIGNNAL